MKKLLLLAVCLILYPSLLWATLRTVTISWTLPETINVQGYKVYYADNSAMTNKTWHSDCSNPTENPTNTFTITCNNLDLTDNHTYYFTIVAQLTDNSETTSSPKDATYVASTPTEMTPVQDFKIVIPGENIAPTAAISASPTTGTAPLAVSFDASKSSDTDGNVVSYSWNFGDGTPTITTTTPNTTHTFTSEGSYLISLTVTDDGNKISHAQNVTISTNTSSNLLYAVNFQPANVSIPDGFIADSGAIYDSDRGYGWVPAQAETRDRNETMSPDQSYDTLIMVDANGKWEIGVANGTYSITICVGDPYWQNTTNVIKAEDVQIVNDTIDSNNIWFEKTGTVIVNDGHLTLTFQNSSPYTKMCWIKISTETQQ